MSELDNNGKKKERFTLFSWMTKDGIGVDPDEPPVMSDPGMKNYFKLLGRKLNQIITVNLLMLACNFTVIFASRHCGIFLHQYRRSLRFQLLSVYGSYGRSSRIWLFR